ncbi:MAG: hypothetical protein F6K31_14435 [Symploca sp. SIO2G7]|nr:hypothetical protein [Symploca sp. SIO2G7]
MGNGEWGMGNGEWGMGNGEWGIVSASQLSPLSPRREHPILAEILSSPAALKDTKLLSSPASLSSLVQRAWK